MNRKGEKFGNLTLSIQASSFHYCTPRVDGLALEEYKSVEVALISGQGHFIVPSAIGAPELDRLWGGDDVAGRVTWEDVERLRNACARHAEMNL